MTRLIGRVMERVMTPAMTAPIRTPKPNATTITQLELATIERVCRIHLVRTRPRRPSEWTAPPSSRFRRFAFIFGRMVCRRSLSFLAQALTAARYSSVALDARSMAACSSGVSGHLAQGRVQFVQLLDLEDQDFPLVEVPPDDVALLAEPGAEGRLGYRQYDEHGLVDLLENWACLVRV